MHRGRDRGNGARSLSGRKVKEGDESIIYDEFGVRVIVHRAVIKTGLPQPL